MRQVPGIAEALRTLADEKYDLVLVDAAASADRDLEAVSQMGDRAKAPLVMLVDSRDLASARRAVQLGAVQDYLVKGHASEDLFRQALAYSVERARMLRSAERDATTRRIAGSRDSVTRLPGEEEMRSRLAQALSEARQKAHMVGILVLEVDGLRLIHSTLGPEIGDRLIQCAAKRIGEGITGCIRESDLVARLGEGRFGVLLAGIVQMKDAATVAENIQRGFRRPFLVKGMEFFLTVAGGISVYPFDGADGETILRNADAALHRAREQGGGGHQFFLPAVNDAYLTRLELVNSLRIALTREEFQVWYMPEIDVPSGKIVAMEALVRWRHPTLGMVAPAQFIPLAEETGLIVPLGERVLREACRQSRTWQLAGLPRVRVAVNLSARQLEQQNPISMVARALRDSGLDPGDLELEITESAAMREGEETIGRLEALRDAGVKLCIDDFGTGYSSFSRLRKLPIDGVKVDRSFVQGLPAESDGSAIVGAILAMARQLKMRVVAEGVETVEQLEFLHSLKCDEAQGYLISRPLPPEQAARLLSEDRRF